MAEFQAGSNGDVAAERVVEFLEENTVGEVSAHRTYGGVRRAYPRPPRFGMARPYAHPAGYMYPPPPPNRCWSQDHVGGLIGYRPAPGYGYPPPPAYAYAPPPPAYAYAPPPRQGRLGLLALPELLLLGRMIPDGSDYEFGFGDFFFDFDGLPYAQ